MNRTLENVLAGLATLLVIAVWVWMSFISDDVAPLGVKLIGTTSTVILFGLVVVVLVAVLLDRRESRQPIPAKPPISPKHPREPIPDSMRIKVWTKDGGRCQWKEKGASSICGRREHLEIDHIVPVSRGGKNTFRNLQLLCQEHNRRKSDLHFELPQDDAADVPAKPPPELAA